MVPALYGKWCEVRINRRLRGETRFMNDNVQCSNYVNCVGSSLAGRDSVLALQLGLVGGSIRRDLRDLQHTLILGIEL